jgi:hypothetical protein
MTGAGNANRSESVSVGTATGASFSIGAAIACTPNGGGVVADALIGADIGGPAVTGAPPFGVFQPSVLPLEDSADVGVAISAKFEFGGAVALCIIGRGSP